MIFGIAYQKMLKHMEFINTGALLMLADLVMCYFMMIKSSLPRSKPFFCMAIWY